ncbi:MAG: Omp28 family outer membrane lipoprotein [Bradyrhizobiaceae bacterium]|nr:Omp28 family outer membrane lipoprotein [Bradyrhizobiaceae bacterium]
MKTAVALALALACLTACDIVDNPVQKTEVPVDTTSTFKQNVLIEDYTGITCGNCPGAAEVAHQLQETYGHDRVVVVAVHSGPFAVPAPPDYPDDFRCPEGDELDNTFRVSRVGNPNGLVNRTAKDGKLVRGKSDWAPLTTQLLTQQPKLGMKVTLDWNSSTRTATVDVDLTYLTDGTPDYYLAAWVIEDSLVGSQMDYNKNPSHITGYRFDHVLRSSVTGVWGEQISPTAVSAGTKISKQLTYTFPSGKTWNPDNCQIVLFVHRYQTEKNVVQVIALPIKK